jgi:2-keto-3-deoxy-L-rhamnonate aldolase RhmA
MLKPAADLKKKLDTQEPVIGLMATDQAWPFLVEICKNSGLDYLVVDREHGAFSDELVSHLCQVGRLMDFPVLVRAVSCEMSVVRRIVDLGPSGLLLPCVESTDELDQVQQAVQMPPRGRRRPGGMGNYWQSNYHSQTWKSDFEDHFIVIPQIESQAGVTNAVVIAAHPLVTAMGLGPYDLSADLGCCWDLQQPEFIQALAQVKAAADQAGKKVWAGTDAVALQKLGYTFLWIGTVTSTLTHALSESVQKIRGTCDAAGVSESPPA